MLLRAIVIGVLAAIEEPVASGRRSAQCLQDLGRLEGLVLCGIGLLLAPRQTPLGPRPRPRPSRARLRLAQPLGIRGFVFGFSCGLNQGALLHALTVLPRVKTLENTAEVCRREP